MILFDLYEDPFPGFHSILCPPKYYSPSWWFSAMNSSPFPCIVHDTSPPRFYPWLSLCSFHQVIHMASDYTGSYCNHVDCSQNNILNLILPPRTYPWTGWWPLPWLFPTTSQFLLCMHSWYLLTMLFSELSCLCFNRGCSWSCHGSA